MQMTRVELVQIPDWRIKAAPICRGDFAVQRGFRTASSDQKIPMRGVPFHSTPAKRSRATCDGLLFVTVVTRANVLGDDGQRSSQTPASPPFVAVKACLGLYLANPFSKDFSRMPGVASFLTISLAEHSELIALANLDDQKECRERIANRSDTYQEGWEGC